MLDTLNLTTIAKGLSQPGSETESSIMPLSLAISEHSLVRDVRSYIEELRMSLQQDSHVSHFQTPESNLEPTIPEICGPQQSNACAWYDPSTLCWKMCQGWLLADISEPSWETWPKAGLIVDGEFFRQPKQERRISEIDCGLWLSPTATNISGRSEEGMGKRKKLRESIGRKTVPPGNLAEQVMYGMPTRHMLPTPRANEHGDYQYDRGDHSKPRPTLTGWVKLFPTPTVNDAKNSTLPPSQINHDNLPVALLRDGESPGGQLNPVWVEWLMGWPLNWTSLEPLSIDDFNQWVNAQYNNSWWKQEPDIPRVASGVKERVNRLKALGNGQVSICAFTAWQLLAE